MVNSFGRIFRVSIYGESHGRGVGVVVDGVPAGIELRAEDFSEDMRRRSGGFKGVTARKEKDNPEFISGIFNNRTTGSPLNIFFKNSDHISEDYTDNVGVPRPGHADLTAFIKFGGFSAPYGGGHFSGRLTAAIVAAGVVAKKILKGIEFSSSIVEIGGIKNIKKAVEEVEHSKDSIGGVVECRVKNIPAGIGEPFFDSVESLLSHLIFSIPGIKGVEFGAGFKGSGLRGSENNDGFGGSVNERVSNNAGGVEGGITNGEDVVFRVAVKPASSIGIEQKSFDLKTGEEKVIKTEGRHDKCIALRIPVILEASAAIVMTDLMMLENLINRVEGDI